MEGYSAMTLEKDRKTLLKLFAREQNYKDRLLKIQSKKLINDLSGAKEVKKIQSLLSDNQKKIKVLFKDNQDVIDSSLLLKELSSQLSDMQNQLVMHKRKLVAYREAAKKFKKDLDQAEERKKDFLEEIGMRDEYISIQEAVKLTSVNKASEKIEQEFPTFSDNQKVKNRLTEELSLGPPDAITTEISETIEPNSITVFSELDDYDDLSQIKGIGPKFEILLNNEGINTFEQIANWTEDEVKKRDKQLLFKGRIERERWVEQARQIIENQD